jgi:outer membrane protein assembly factor BamB
VGGDWTRFGYDAARSNSGPARTGITAANVGRLKRQRVVLPGTADSSPIYLRAVRVRGKVRDVFFVTTSYGKTVAIDAATGRTLWVFTPPGYSGWAGTYRITNASPVADPGRSIVYAASPDGKIHKLTVAAGREARGWPVSITRLPEREKIGPALNFSRGLVLEGTGGYIGDAPPYQGHVVAIDARTGRLVNVWNTLCSDRRGLLVPSSCSASDSAVWARAGVVVEPGSGRLLVATGNGPWNGKTNWGDSVLELAPNAGNLLRSWTPTNYSDLERGDIDLGSTAPALVAPGLVVQGGKDAKLRLLRLSALGLGGTGGESQTLATPGGMFTAPAVWHAGATTWVFVATFSGTAALQLSDGSLHVVWSSSNAGTSPVLAGGLLYVYDPDGGLFVYRPATGAVVTRLDAGSGHWSSPIVTDGRVALPEGDANDHATTGVLDIWRLPS